jgi:hypothetical protein
MLNVKLLYQDATIKVAANIAITVLGRVKFHSPSVVGLFLVNVRQFIGDYKISRFKLRSGRK